jgi:hypothetical protein
MMKLRDFRRLAVIKGLPGGLTPDRTADYGHFALVSNINAYAEGLAVIVTAGTNSTLTTAQFLAKNIVLTSGASGGFTLTLPATSAILSAMGPTLPLDGSFYFPLYICNQGVGQTMTLTAGDANTTISATENTLATNISGKWMVQVATSTTLVVTRVFGGTN